VPVGNKPYSLKEEFNIAHPNPHVDQPNNNLNPFEFMNFDTHRSIKALIDRGFKETQAEAVVDLVAQSRNHDLSKLATKEQVSTLKEQISRLESTFVTKEQFTKFENATKEQFSRLESATNEWFIKLEAKIDTIEAKLKAMITEKISKLQISNTRWMISILIALVGVGAAVVAVLLKH